MVSIRYRSAVFHVLAGLVCLTSLTGGTPARTGTQGNQVHWTRYQVPHAGPRGGAVPGSHVWRPHGPVARDIGRVFFQLDGLDYVCSAAIVRSPGAEVVLTAAHCVTDGSGGYATTWTFVPGYDDGREPYGSYRARGFYVSRRWRPGTREANDVAFVTLNRGPGPVAGLPIQFGRAPTRVHVFGYPALAPYDGKHLRYCAGRASPGIHEAPGVNATLTPLEGADVASTPPGGPASTPPGGPAGGPPGASAGTARRADPSGVSGVRCAMTAGDSGGPWLAGFNPAEGTGTIVAVTSFRYGGDSRMLYGSDLNATARQLYAAALAGDHGRATPVRAPRSAPLARSRRP